MLYLYCKYNFSYLVVGLLLALALIVFFSSPQYFRTFNSCMKTFLMYRMKANIEVYHFHLFCYT